MNRMVRRPRWRASRASAMAARRSFTPEKTADRAVKRAPVFSDNNRPNVVLPVPGGPQRIKEGKAPPPSIKRRSTRPSPTRCSWPTNSSRVRGRIRSASGPGTRELAVDEASFMSSGNKLSLVRLAIGFQQSSTAPGAQASCRNFLILQVRAAGTFKGTIRLKASYIEASPKKAISKQVIQEAWSMKEAKDVLRLAGMLLLGLFVLVVGVPLVLTAAGIALGIFGFLFGLAVLLIKVAIVVAFIYLILVCLRAVLM